MQSTTPLPKAPRTYAVYAHNSRGVPLAIARDLSFDDANARIALERSQNSRLCILIRDREHKQKTARHPAQFFLELATCHQCGHAASQHLDNGGCTICYANGVDNGEPVLAADDCIEFRFDPGCTRSSKSVLLDFLADLDFEGYIKTIPPLTIQDDPSGIGFHRAPAPPLPPTASVLPFAD